jgi:hypothetical protein
MAPGWQLAAVAATAGRDAPVHSDPVASDEPASVDLLEAIRGALDDIDDLLVDRVVDVEMARLRVLADPPSLRREIGALVAAAIAQAAASDGLTVRVARTGKSARIEVRSETAGGEDVVAGSMSVPVAPGSSGGHGA